MPVGPLSFLCACACGADALILDHISAKQCCSIEQETPAEPQQQAEEAKEQTAGPRGASDAEVAALKEAHAARVHELEQELAVERERVEAAQRDIAAKEAAQLEAAANLKVFKGTCSLPPRS